MKPSWGVVATVKCPEDQLMAFIAYHFALGAARIWIYFDDPEDPAFARISTLPRVTAIRCTNLYWVLRIGRSDQLPHRQKANARLTQRKCKLDWLCHIDVDEYIHTPRPVADILAEVPADVSDLLMEPFEAMHDPGLPDDIFTAQHFRGILSGEHKKLQPAIFGKMAPALAKGGLSHTIGKSFCRMRTKGAVIDVHRVRKNGKYPVSPFHPEMRLLHFHAHDPSEWRRALPFRLTGGAYNLEAGALLTFLRSADDAALREFYETAMTLTPEKIALLQAHDRLITANLGLRAKVADLLAGRLG